MKHHTYLARAMRIFEITRRARFRKSDLIELMEGDRDYSGMDAIIEQYGIKPPASQYSRKAIKRAYDRALLRAGEAGLIDSSAGE
ncbi:hypothetical protein Ga0123461_0440 [Mariprofundus aestuarium]|uniref:Uncharacterized protein n=1 Tax=Mariprofundus aestuarium TaxID=1921086 RepID=A0A2K8KVP6_MARES|nr:hypothetical protein [Mariprofundus aestuarium]ATX78877.1 hypothetical protein Ga0123461_0440 [Mariprofundus aestuarium]